MPVLAAAVGEWGSGKTYDCLAVTIPLVGCALHSGVVPDGAGGYLISQQAATGFPGLGNIKADLMQEGWAPIGDK